jgi:hypothetical protein
MKMFTAAKRIKNVNLGDASYDYKTESQTTLSKSNVSHALNSRTTGEASFASDDFMV